MSIPFTHCPLTGRRNLRWWCTWHRTCLQWWWWSDSHFVQKTCRIPTFCVPNLIPPARFYICNWSKRYCDPTEPHNDLTPPQVFKAQNGCLTTITLLGPLYAGIDCLVFRDCLTALFLIPDSWFLNPEAKILQDNVKFSFKKPKLLCRYLEVGNPLATTHIVEHIDCIIFKCWCSWQIHIPFRYKKKICFK